MAAQVRALLAKAESTEFEEEAEALTAKAQELIAKHAIDQAVLDDAGGDAGEVMGRRVLLDDPYAKAKSMLLAAVAGANRCRTVSNPSFEFVTVFGFPADLDAVELLFSSLLTQATASMVPVSNSAGYAAGRAAADLAELGQSGRLKAG